MPAFLPNPAPYPVATSENTSNSSLTNSVSYFFGVCALKPSPTPNLHLPLAHPHPLLHFYSSITPLIHQVNPVPHLGISVLSPLSTSPNLQWLNVLLDTCYLIVSSLDIYLHKVQDHFCFMYYSFSKIYTTLNVQLSFVKVLK